MRDRTSALWYVLALLALANFLHYANRNVVVTMYDDLRHAFDFGNAELGLLMTVFMVAHAPATIFFGWLSDRMSRKTILTLGVLLWSAAVVMTTFASGVVSILVLRAIAGLGTAACVPVANALICDFVPPERKARAVSFFNLGLFFGGAVGMLLGKKLGFPTVFLLLGIPGFLVAALIAALKLGGAARGHQQGRAMPASSLVSILSLRTFRLMLVGAILMAFSVGGYLSWFFDFLENTKKATEDEALLVFGVSLLTGLVGVVFGGWLADRLMRASASGRQLTAAIGIAASVPMALLVIYLPLGWGFYIAAWLMMFSINWYHGPLAAAVDDLVPRQQAGLAQGIYIAAMHLCGTAPAAYVVGRLAQRYGLGTALLLPTLTMVLAALCFVASARESAMVQD